MNEVNYYILNDKFENVAPLDDYESIIWTDRYSDAGDFEIYTGLTEQAGTFLQMNYYLKSLLSEHIMILSSNEISSDSESGNVLIIRGESLESILKIRIIWTQTTLNGNLQDAVERLLNENLINPSIKNRKIDNFIFVKSTDERITNLTIQAQFTGDVLFDAIKAICDNVKIGFKVTLTAQNQLAFMLYCGDNRTYSQKENPYVIISKDYDNIVNSDFLTSNDTLRNVALVAGEGEGLNRRTYITGNNNISGLNRRELYVDARDISSELSDGGTLSPDQYNALLKQRGDEKLAENVITRSFDGQIDPLGQFKYKEDYFLGDIIQFDDGYGNSAHARVSEYIYSDSNTGTEAYPTLDIMGDMVTYYVDIGDIYTEEVNSGESVLSPKTFTPKKTGWEFVGWRQDGKADGDVVTVLTMGYEPISLYAVFRQAVTVNYYDLNAYLFSTKYKYYNNNVIANPKFTITPTTYAGWTFRGWGTNGTGNAEVIYKEIKDTEFSSNATIYGLYQTNIVLSYNSNGGTGNIAPSSQMAYYNSVGTSVYPTFTLASNAFNRPNYNFVQWRMGNINGTPYKAGAKVTLQSNTVFYAEWVAVAHRVTYIYDGSTAYRMVAPGNTVLSPDIKPSKSGCTFLGWTNNVNAAEPLKTLNMGSNDITLYAVWKAKDKSLIAYNNYTYKDKYILPIDENFDSLAFSDSVDMSLYSGVHIELLQLTQTASEIWNDTGYKVGIYVSDGTEYDISYMYVNQNTMRYGSFNNIPYTYAENIQFLTIENQSFDINFKSSNMNNASIYWRMANYNTISHVGYVYRVSTFTNVGNCYLIGRQFAK